MSWRIPPIGWCGLCLLRNEERAALVLWRGSGLCQMHLAEVHDEENEL